MALILYRATILVCTVVQNGRLLLLYLKMEVKVASRGFQQKVMLTWHICRDNRNTETHPPTPLGITGTITGGEREGKEGGSRLRILSRLRGF